MAKATRTPSSSAGQAADLSSESLQVADGADAPEDIIPPTRIIKPHDGSEPYVLDKPWSPNEGSSGDASAGSGTSE